MSIDIEHINGHVVMYYCEKCGVTTIKEQLSYIRPPMDRADAFYVLAACNDISEHNSFASEAPIIGVGAAGLPWVYL